MAFPFDVLSWLVRARYKLTPPAATDGETIELQATVNGALKVSSEAPAPGGYARTLEDTDALVKGTPGELIELWGFSRDAEQDLYLLLVNKASAAVDGDTPLEVFPIPALQPFAFAPRAPLAFSVGIVWAVSTLPDEVALPISGGAFCVTVAYR